MTKVGRNGPCPCGSGKKYKKCCLYRGIEVQSASITEDSSKEILVQTLTNELFQPVRLYYKIYDKNKLQSHFHTLDCMDYNSKLDDWTLMYIEEAAHIPLKVLPKDVPKQAQPLIIATIYIEASNIMLIDLRSIERAARIIEFIDKYVPRKIAEVTHAAIYNQLVTCPEKDPKKVRDIDYDEIFDECNITCIDPDKTIQESQEFMAQYKDKRRAFDAWAKETEERAKKQLPKVEKFPIYYYDEGIIHFETACRMRQVIAAQHFFGNKDFSFHDLIQKIFKRS